VNSLVIFSAAETNVTTVNCSLGYAPHAGPLPAQHATLGSIATDMGVLSAHSAMQANSRMLRGVPLVTNVAWKLGASGEPPSAILASRASTLSDRKSRTVLIADLAAMPPPVAFLRAPNVAEASTCRTMAVLQRVIAQHARQASERNSSAADDTCLLLTCFATHEYPTNKILEPRT